MVSRRNYVGIERKNQMTTKTFIQHLVIAFMLLSIAKGQAQDVYQLWEGQEMPYYKENSLKEYEKEAWGVNCAFNITQPTLTVYQAKGENTGRSVVVLPGGGYVLEAIAHEGHEVARALAEEGITAAVLKYRLPNPESSDQPQFVPLSDTRKALKFMRANSEKYGLDKNKVGLIGFSAGSHLATVAALWKSEAVDEQPDFTALIYGVTNLSSDNLKWLEETLYHRKMTDADMAQNTLLELVTEETPPAFLVHALDDNVCNVEESTLYTDKLIEHGVLAEVHLFTKGGHGFGLGRKADGTDQWLKLFVNWLKINEL